MWAVGVWSYLDCDPGVELGHGVPQGFNPDQQKDKMTKFTNPSTTRNCNGASPSLVGRSLKRRSPIG